MSKCKGCGLSISLCICQPINEQETIKTIKRHLKGIEKAVEQLEAKKIKKLSCDDCRKCGETICGNDTEHLRCFEPK
jgi:hypothetical protein